MSGTRMLLAAATLLLAGATMTQDATAQEEFDNPTLGTAPCIVIDEYVIDRIESDDDTLTYRGGAELSNICGRAMDVSFCFVLIEPSDAGDRLCYTGIVRPWSEATFVTDPIQARIVDREINWRYHTS